MSSQGVTPGFRHGVASGGKLSLNTPVVDQFVTLSSEAMHLIQQHVGISGVVGHSQDLGSAPRSELGSKSRGGISDVLMFINVSDPTVRKIHSCLLLLWILRCSKMQVVRDPLSVVDHL